MKQLFLNIVFKLISFMIELKIISKTLLVIVLITSLFSLPQNFINLETIIIFTLFTIRVIFDGISFKYISFIIALSGSVIFNPFYPLEFSESALHLIEIFYIIIVNIWVIADIFSYLYSGTDPNY